MKRAHFIGLAGGALTATAAAIYFTSDRKNLLRVDLAASEAPFVPSAIPATLVTLPADAQAILQLASLAPSGHNTQPWFVQALAPYHWLIGNDRRRWLPAVDPDQRETLLSLSAFAQNLEYAAAAFGYTSHWTLLATTNQDARVLDVALTPAPSLTRFDVTPLKTRRTVRAGYLLDPLRAPDRAHLLAGEHGFIHYLPTGSPESRWLAAQTVEANRLQAQRDPAQRELAGWIRFSNASARQHRDGLSTSGLELTGLAA
jgi:hypothetical protein